MARVLYVEASPRKDRSASIAVAKAFLDAYQSSHPDDTIEKLDLWAAPLPEFDGAVLNAKYNVLHGKPHSPTDAAAWSAIVDRCKHFTSFDKYVFSLPMWNFGIPYKLKHYIDIITQPGLTFSFSPTEGYKGLVTGKPAVVVYARGGDYPSGTAGASFDLQQGYMKVLLGFIGFTDVHSIVVEPTLNAPDAVEAMKTAKINEAKSLAAKF